MIAENDATPAEIADPVRMIIDEDACIGGGVCEMLEEATFLLDDDTVIAAIVGDGLLARERAEIVVDRCPGRALSFVEIGSGLEAGTEGRSPGEGDED